MRRVHLLGRAEILRLETHGVSVLLGSAWPNEIVEKAQFGSLRDLGLRASLESSPLMRCVYDLCASNLLCHTRSRRGCAPAFVLLQHSG